MEAVAMMVQVHSTMMLLHRNIDKQQLLLLIPIAQGK